MNCPRCQKPLSRYLHDAGGLEVEALRCPACTGHWFEQSALKTVEQTVEVSFFDWIKLPGDVTQARTVYCPRCVPEKVMDKVINERDSRVVMDLCGACHGVWLDYGELKAIQRRNVLSAVIDAVRFIKNN